MITFCALPYLTQCIVCESHATRVEQRNAHSDIARVVAIAVIGALNIVAASCCLQFAAHNWFADVVVVIVIRRR